MSDFKIGDRVYDISPLNASDAFDLQPKLWPACIEILATWARLGTDADIVGALGGDKSDGKEKKRTWKEIGDIDLSEVGDLINNAAPIIVGTVAAVFSKMPSPLLREVRLTLLANALCNGQALFSSAGNTFDRLMQGRMIEVWRLILFALRVNYPDFFGLAAGVTGARAASDSKSPTV